MGIVIGNFFKLPMQLSQGISFSSSKVLEFSILFWHLVSTIPIWEKLDGKVF
ncbi:hypothetical protein H9X57_03760 [Flavobacterium piscinae]|nr:hypothetical protein [Flavobacterium piscinae]